MNVYQAEHNNCEPYEDNHVFREDMVYTDITMLIKRLRNQGYVERRGYQGRQEFVKGNPKRFDDFDLVTICKLDVIGFKEDK